MKAVLQYRASPGFRGQIERETPPWLEVVVVEETDRQRFGREMRDARVLLHVLEPVTAAVIAAAPHLGLVQKLGVGVNTIDVEAARARGIAVCNMPGTNTAAVAELALLLVLGALRRVSYFDRATRQGLGWQAELQHFDGVGELAGRSVGLVGYGAVARHLAPALAALGARVLYTARTPKSDTQAAWRMLPELLAEADVVSLHLPLTPETEKLMNAERLARMKPGSVLVNTARGGLVDEVALLEALRSGHLRAAGLDVFAEEPVKPDHPLLALDNVVVTPHLAWLTPETLARSLAVAFDNCRRLRDGEPLRHRVV